MEKDWFGPGTHFFSDLLPDDPRHLVTVQFNDRVFHHNLVSYNIIVRDETGDRSAIIDSMDVTSPLRVMAPTTKVQHSRYDGMLFAKPREMMVLVTNGARWGRARGSRPRRMVRESIMGK
jgi:hypothetical protein